MPAAKFRETVKAGGANLPAAPAVDLELVITNHTKADVRVRTAGALPRLSLTVTGPDVVEARAPRLPRQRVTYVVLRPGQSVSVPITSLHSRKTAAQSVQHYWTEPGEYTLSASFYTSVQMDWNPGGGKVARGYTTLKTRATKVKVEK
jgi:hypothetical protein